MKNKACLLISVFVFCFLTFLQPSQNQDEDNSYSKKEITIMAKAGDGNDGDEDNGATCYHWWTGIGTWSIISCYSCDRVYLVKEFAMQSNC